LISKRKVDLIDVIIILLQGSWGSRGHDRMVVGFTTTYAISAYHH